VRVTKEMLRAKKSKGSAPFSCADLTRHRDYQKACNDAQEATSSDTLAKSAGRHPASKLGRHTAMDTPYTPSMRDLEARFRRASGLANRSDYKIYYGQVHPAPILILGINPGGAPSNTNPDGRTYKDGSIAAASSSYFENDEHDILDCKWRENYGLQSLLTPLVGGDTQLIRQKVVKTNIAFHRSAKKKDIDIDRANAETAPFLAELISVVKPSTILLTGVSIDEFNDRFASTSSIVVPAERDPRINQVVFAASKSELRATGAEALVVQLAHASLFGWTYARYQVAKRIAAIGV
jgi:hypothetical protein